MGQCGQPRVQHLGTFRCVLERKKLSEVQILWSILYSPVLLLTRTIALFSLLVSTCWASVCILVHDLVPLWWSQLRHLRQSYHKWRGKQGGALICHLWCFPVFVSSQFPALFCSLVRVMIVSWTQIGLLRHEFIPLWSCRVQHLSPYYCSRKPKQRGKGVISCHVWYLPVLVLSWLTALSCFIAISLHLQHLLPTFSMTSNLLFVLYLHMVRLWWHVAAVQSEEQSTSRRYNSNQCYSGCFKCPVPVLRKSGVFFLNGASVSKVCRSLKKDGPKVISLLLLLSGDVETNPGPGNTRIEAAHCGSLCEKLRPCAMKWQQIAQYLQFTSCEISNIKNNPENLQSNSFLDVMVGEWLEWAPGDARGSEKYATLEQLQAALIRAGYDVIASELMKEQVIEEQKTEEPTPSDNDVVKCSSQGMFPQEADPAGVSSRDQLYVKRARVSSDESSHSVKKQKMDPMAGSVGKTALVLCDEVANGLECWITTGDELYLSAARQGLTVIRNEDGDTAIHLAVRYDHQNLLQLLPQVPPSDTPEVDCCNYLGQSPLHLAVQTHQLQAVQYLLRASANPLVCDYEDNTPLHFACRYGFILGTKALLSRTIEGGLIPEINLGNVSG